MRLARAVARALGRRRGLVLGLCALSSLAVGVGAVVAGGSSVGLHLRADAPVPRAVTVHAPGSKRAVTVGHSYKNDVSAPLRSLRPKPFVPRPEREASPNPRPVSLHRDGADPVRQTAVPAPSMPGKSLDFDGIAFPGVGCNCVPPDANGEVGATQYVQSVNVGFQVFSKTTGASVYGPADIATLWSGFGGVCETDGDGDPVVLYDQLAGRWVISQFAGSTVPTDECVAVSTSSDATGTWNRYAFHLGSNFFDYPHLGVWPDGYYLSMNVFNSAGTTYLGPQPFVLDRAAMLAGDPATFQTPGITGGGNEETYLPADLDGSAAPAAGAPNPFVEYPSGSPLVYKVYRFHVDWATPTNTSFTAAPSPAAAPFTSLCPTARACVPQAGVPSSSYLDALGDRLMFRNAYRNFGGHESLLANYTVSSGGVAGIRWVELRNLTSGTPTVFQESTYQPDSTWRWLGSAAMDGDGDIALGFSASSAAIDPQIRYAGRLAGDPPNTLAQGEAHLVNGGGSQRGSDNRWGDYSDLTVDPVDDCTFWYTSEYYSTTGSFEWRTRIGSFRFPSCSPSAGAALSIDKTADAAGVASGSQIGFTVTLTNSGSDPATGVSLDDSLPPGTGVDWHVDAANSSSGWSISGSPPSETLVAPASVAGGAESHVHVVSATTAGSCGTYDNTASFTSANAGSGQASASETVTCATPTCTLAEGFDAMPAWFVQNNSSPLGSTEWFQGEPTAFAAQAGAPSSYVAANYASTNDAGTISDWLLTPLLTLRNGAQLSFWTRKIQETTFYPDRLQVRLSTNGVSTNVGSTATSVGDFTRLLLDVNPTYAPAGYPFAWAKYTVTLSGLSGTTSGRVAFRYFVENGGPSGANSDYIGLDTAAYNCSPPPPPPPAPPPPPPPPPPHSLAVTKTGTGAGTVTSAPSGISCGATCVSTFASGSTVTLTATPAPGSRFVGWSGDCIGTSCQLSLTADRLAVATFAKVARCTVPKTVGLTLKKARAKIVRAHCRVGKVTKKASSRKKKGRVLAQKPRPGRRLAAGARVSLVVGRGPRR